MLFKGDSYVLTGTFGERSPFGFWTNTYVYQGIPESIAALAQGQPLGAQISTRQQGAVVEGTFTYAPDTFADKWEIDRENVDKDIMVSPAFTAINDAGKDFIRNWRNDATVNFVTTADPAHADLMNAAASLIRLGVESVQVSTLILKRTRSISTTLAPTIVLTEQTTFYSTAALVALTNMDPAIAATLPVAPYAAPPNTEWGWLPRLANRSYLSRGSMEEHTDWVFGAISTILYSFSG